MTYEFPPDPPDEPVTDNSEQPRPSRLGHLSKTGSDKYEINKSFNFGGRGESEDETKKDDSDEDDLFKREIDDDEED